MHKKRECEVYAELLKRFDRSGFTECQILDDLIREHGDSVGAFDAAGNPRSAVVDEAFLKHLDTMLAEVIAHARVMRRELYTKAKWFGHPREEVTLGCGYGTDDTMEAFIEVSACGIGAGFAGHGVCNMEPDSEVVFVEHIEGKPRVIVWADINSEDATSTIDLSGAAQSARKEG
jgi:hypothetical protein